MGLFDKFSEVTGSSSIQDAVTSATDSAQGAVNGLMGKAKSALTSGLASLGPAASSSDANDSPPGANLGYYKVLIQAVLPHGQFINLVADGPTEFSYSTSLSYESPYQDMGEKVADKVAGFLGPVGELAKGLIHGSGTRLFTQALTAKVWSGAGETTIQVPLIFQAEEDAEDDVLTPLMQLMYLSMPREDTEGGFLSGPGPVFDWGKVVESKTKNAGAYATSGTGDTPSTFLDKAYAKVEATVKSAISAGERVLAGNGVDVALGAGRGIVAGVSNYIKGKVDYPISLQIGQGFRLENVVIESVTQTHRLQPVGTAYNKSSGINSRVTVEVTFKTFYTLTQRDIAKMLLPMSQPDSKTRAAYWKLQSKDVEGGG